MFKSSDVKSQPRSPAAQPIVVAPTHSLAVEKNALLQQVITLLTAQKSVLPLVLSAFLAMASNTQILAPNNNQEGVDGSLDRLQYLEERLARMEKRHTIVGQGPKPLTFNGLFERMESKQIYRPTSTITVNVVTKSEGYTTQEIKYN